VLTVGAVCCNPIYCPPLPRARRPPFARVPVKASSYNFSLPRQDGSWLLFNARTGNVIDLVGSNAQALAQSLIGADCEDEIVVDSNSFQLLSAQEFIVDDSYDELAAIRNVYWQARNNAPVVITITTTLDCNLGCFYCYEERSPDSLGAEDIPSIIEKIETLLLSSPRKSIHVDWYGGEPTLNLRFLEEASSEIQKLCSVQEVRYSASIISNGTMWPDDVEAFIQRHQIRQVQITFDGLRASHNRRRRFTQQADYGRSSFDEAAALISRLVHVCRVDIRFNIDERNRSDFIPFVEFALAQGWFSADYRVTFQPACVLPFTEKSRFVEKIGLSDEEFHSLKREAASMLPVGVMEEPETPSGYAAPKRSVCAALSNNAVVFGADRRTYRCGLQVSEPARAVGILNQSAFKILNNDDVSSDERWWAEFDPTTLASCSQCSFLPICLGGCAKKQLDMDKGALDAVSLYWRKHLPRLICKSAAIPEIEWEFTERDQFRSDPTSSASPDALE
jgi:uncharacterized protein